MRKAVVSITILLASIFLFTSCSLSDGLTDKADIIDLFNQHKDAIISAVDGGNFDEIEKICGIQSIYVADNYIDFSCGGAGFGPNTQYYGFFYSEEDDLTAWNGGACPADELYEFENGYKYQQTDGDNEYYVKKIDEHFFYYEAHF
jgi:lipoprotein